MGRARAKTKKAVTVLPTEATTTTAPPSLSSLLEKAQNLVAQYDYELATRFLQRILERSPTHVAAREMLGIVQLETGEIAAAKNVCGRNNCGYP